MTGVLPFLFFFHKHTIITIKDAHSSQSTTIMDTIITSMDARTQPEYIEGKDFTWVYDHNGDLVKYWHASHRIDKDVPRYPEPEGDPSY